MNNISSKIIFYYSHMKLYNFLIYELFSDIKLQKRCINSPLRSFGSNHVDLGGISLPESAIRRSSSMEVGYIENAIPPELSAACSRASAPFISQIKRTR